MTMTTPMSGATLTLLLSVAVAALAVLAARCVRGYLAFRRAELAIPGPPSLPFLGNALEFLGVNRTNVLDRALEVFAFSSDAFRLSVLGKLFVVVSDPEDLDALTKRKDLLDKSHFLYDIFRELAPKGLSWLMGDEWRKHRRTLQPAFHRAVVDRFQDTFAAEAAAFVARVQPGRDVDLSEGVGRALSRSFMHAMLRDGATEDLDRLTDASVQLLHAFVVDTHTRTMRPHLWPDFVHRRTEAAKRTLKFKRLVEGMAREVVESRRRVLELERKQQQQGAADASKERKSVLDALLTADEEGRLSDSDVCDEIMMVFAAAVESTEAAICILLKVLSLLPDVQQRICDELREVRQGSSGEVTTAELDRLQYTDRVINETMRVFPPLPFVARENHEGATKFAGHTIPRNTTFVMNILGAHRDPRHWPEPLRFDPDRFLPENCAVRHPGAFLPFSSGARDCPGRVYALRTMKTFLAAVLPVYRLEAAKGDEGREVGALRVTFDITMKFVGGSVVRFEPRERPAARVAA